ncbi:MAG: hypothetical protein A4E20_10950 [Nitrospira sp. SG-bin2]|uniref:hypothetical protein n=1 Tax=Nitrospira cf. moscoviensis SBR1015 TaxID=96242 RepID=UPI000A0968FE|nr:hypothetical protein [Nitrospira cf. moscoviensis SBR1015]OQW34530.1 MAG: hypothetical protein A4E20_10950 [Nitrospira sp. SG-bin2]
MSDANSVIKQAAIDWFHPNWRQAEGFGAFVLNQLQAVGYEVVHVPEGMRLSLRYDRDAEITRLNAAEQTGT